MKFDRKTILFCVLSLALVVALIFCAVLGSSAKREKRRTEELCKFYVNAAYDSFIQYKENESQMHYFAAVADLYSFIQLHFNGNYDSADYTACNELYWNMLASPAWAQGHVDELISVFELLKINGNHPSAYEKVRSLNNALHEGR